MSSVAAALNIVWFKRDLRIEDHAPLVHAAETGPTIPVYVVEPEWWAQPSMSGRQWSFVQECLSELEAALAQLGLELLRQYGDAAEIFDSLLTKLGPFTLWSHEETGDAWSFARDRRVRAWARARGVAWREYQTGGVIRRLRSRDGWSSAWERSMRTRPLGAPKRVQAADFPNLSGRAAPPPLEQDACPERQAGGRRAGTELLSDFLSRRGQHYRREMSSPVTAYEACSRLSPHLAWGTFSTREIAHTARDALAERRAAGHRDGWTGSIESFLARLHWRCHFMQKLEDEPELEHKCLHRAHENLRKTDPARLAAWTAGETGWPLVDACMRALTATGWLNFRMRAMVSSVAGYHLWMDWRDYGPPLARLFTDYEPGIHWSQLQMQAGATGINTIRVYNPVKQQTDHDPEGTFVRRWIPELRRVPNEYLHMPWKMDAQMQAEVGCVLDLDYPRPLLDHEAAARDAKNRLFAARRADVHFAIEKARIIEKHASRKRPNDRSRTVRRRATGEQLSLGL